MDCPPSLCVQLQQRTDVLISVNTPAWLGIFCTLGLFVFYSLRHLDRLFLLFFRIMYVTVAKLLAWRKHFCLCINRIETVCLKSCVNRIETVCPKICVQQLVLYCCFQGML